MTSPSPGPGAGALGRLIRAQRENAQLSLREMARMAQISNAYLSQVERGFHEPSIRILNALADALDIPVADLIDQDPQPDEASPSVVAAVRADARLDPAQRQALIAVYRTYVDDSDDID